MEGIEMTVASSSNRVDYTGNGSTTVFSFNFRILAATDLVVTKADTDGVETELVLNTDYTVSGVGSYSGGSITLASALTDGYALTIVRQVPITQETDLRNQGSFFAETHEDVFDRLTMVAQQLQEQIDRSAKLPVTRTEDADALVADIVLLADNISDLDTLAANLSDITTVADDLNEPVSEIETVAGSIANVNTVGTNIANVNTVAGNNANVTTVAGISANVTTVAGISGNVTTVAGNNANVTTVAGISSNVTTVAGISSAVSTVATNNANVSTVATNIAPVNTVSTNIASVNSAASNMAAIIDAPNQAAAAAASAAAAATALDNFDDRYLGAKTSDPTLDNDGNALLTGALYYRSTAPIGMKVYDGAQWLEASAAQQAALVAYEYVATAGQTTFSGPDANALTLSYIAGGLIVALNGVVLRPGDDFTATNGTSIVLTVAAALNDELVAYAFSSFNIANTYTQAQSDSRYAQVAENNTFTKAQRGGVTALTDGATITADFAVSNNFSVTLGGNRTLANPTNQTAGQSGAITITQDATGSRTLAYGSNWKFSNGTAPTLTTTANAVDILVYFVESSSRITARLVSDVK
jgi:hypothetical protein